MISGGVRTIGFSGLLALASGLPACSTDDEPATGSGSTSSEATTGSNTTTADTAGTGPDATTGSDETSSGGSAATGDTETGNSSSSGAVDKIDYLDVYSLDATFPEGGTFDPTEQMFYVGTLEGGDLYRIDPRTGENTVLFDQVEPGEWMTLGMAVDNERRRLWVCAADRATDPFTGQIWVFDLETGTRDQVIELTANGGAAWCEDVAVAPDGSAYATDRENPNIYKVDSKLDSEFAVSLFASDSELGSPLIGQNGIIVLPDAAGLIAAVHLPASLNHISLDGTVTPVAIEGDFVDGAVGSGADGMVYVDGDLYVVFDGELIRVTPTLADWSAAMATAVELPRGLTDIIDTPGGLYLLNGQAIRFAFGQDPDGPFELVRYTGDL